MILCLDPLNYRAGRPSLWGDWAQGYKARSWALLTSGLVCGLLWEFWNYWASAKRLHIVEFALDEYRIFEMPLVQLSILPVFAPAIFSLYVVAASIAELPQYQIR